MHVPFQAVFHGCGRGRGAAVTAAATAAVVAVTIPATTASLDGPLSVYAMATTGNGPSSCGKGTSASADACKAMTTGRRHATLTTRTFHRHLQLHCRTPHPFEGRRKRFCARSVTTRRHGTPKPRQFRVGDTADRRDGNRPSRPTIRKMEPSKSPFKFPVPSAAPASHPASASTISGVSDGKTPAGQVPSSPPTASPGLPVSPAWHTWAPIGAGVGAGCFLVLGSWVIRCYLTLTP